MRSAISSRCLTDSRRARRNDLLSRCQRPTPQIPVPCLEPLSGSGVLEGFVLEPLRLHADTQAGAQQPLLVRRHDVRHGLPVEHVAMKPHPALQGVDHAVTAFVKHEPPFRACDGRHSAYCRHRFASSQLEPMPTSTTSGTLRSPALVISVRTIVATVAASDSGTSRISSS